MEDYQGAINDFTTAIKLDSSYENAYFGRGDAKLNMKDYRGAVKDYSLIIIESRRMVKGIIKEVCVMSYGIKRKRHVKI